MKTQRIALKTGTYTGRDGQTKNRYKTIGELITKDDGGQFVTLDATLVSMQLFALANKDRNDKLTCSLFSDEPREASAAPAKAGAMDDLVDDIPF
jgi:hypothetical protein